MTNKQLRDRVVNEIGLQDIAAYDETGLVNDLIYQGTVDLLARTRCTARCVHLKTTANVDTYDLDHSILALVDVDDGADPRARRDEDYVPSFTLIRSDILRISPTPTADGEVDVWAVVRPQKMASDTDSPDQDNFGGIPGEYHDAIFLYACWMAASYADDDSAQMGERYRALYEGPDGRGGKLSFIKSLVNKRGTSRAPRRRVSVRTVTPHTSYVG